MSKEVGAGGRFDIFLDSAKIVDMVMAVNKVDYAGSFFIMNEVKLGSCCCDKIKFNEFLSAKK